MKIAVLDTITLLPGARLIEPKPHLIDSPSSRLPGRFCVRRQSTDDLAMAKLVSSAIAGVMRLLPADGK
jgi:hypothetical protein